MKPFRIALVLICLTAFPALAADHVLDLTGWAAWIDPNSNGTFNSSFPSQPYNVRFDGKMGYGIGANIFFGNHFSAAFDVSQVRPGTSLRSRTGSTSFPTTGTRMTPITGILQWHIAPGGGIDPYIGVGAAYVVFDKTNVFHSATLSQINIKDDAGLALNAGVSFRLSRRLALTADGKYVPLKAGATPVYAAIPTIPIVLNAKINPVIFSGGLTLRF